MSRHLKFEVTVVFSDAITSDEDIMEIAENIANAIRNEANNGVRIAPEESEAYTQMVYIKPQFLDETVTLKI